MSTPWTPKPWVYVDGLLRQEGGRPIIAKTYQQPHEDADGDLLALSPEWPEVMRRLVNEAVWVNSTGCPGFELALGVARTLLARLPKREVEVLGE